ncbi:3981_t:CDS:2, partial [Cetraspora pellucida]
IKNMSNKDLVRKRNELLVKDLIRIDRIRREGITYEEVIMNPEKYAPSTWFQAPKDIQIIEETGESSNTMNDVIEEINDNRNDGMIDDIVEFLIESGDEEEDVYNENYIIDD